MTEGIVKWYNMKRGYGFIQTEDSEKDIFIHVTSLQKSGLKKLQEGQRVSFELYEDKGLPAACNVSVKPAFDKGDGG